MFARPIIRGIVIGIKEDGTAKVKIVLPEDSPGKVTDEVMIRCDHHHTPVLHDGRHGIEFGEKSQPRVPVMDDLVFLRRHERNPSLAWAWCYENDIVIKAPPPKVELVVKETEHGPMVLTQESQTHLSRYAKKQRRARLQSVA